jgi:hypothetical protein
VNNVHCAAACGTVFVRLRRREMSAQQEDVRVEDVLVTELRPLIPPAVLQEEHPISAELGKHVRSGRRQATDIITGVSDRLLVIVGPCSIHDYKAALDYGTQYLFSTLIFLETIAHPAGIDRSPAEGGGG